MSRQGRRKLQMLPKPLIPSLSRATVVPSLSGYGAVLA